MDSSKDDGTLLPPGFPIRISTVRCLLAAPRGFSQLATSFFGVWCLGIHPALLLAWPNRSESGWNLGKWPLKACFHKDIFADFMAFAEQMALRSVSFEVTVWTRAGCFLIPRCIALHLWSGLFTKFVVLFSTWSITWPHGLGCLDIQLNYQFISIQYAVFKVRIWLTFLSVICRFKPL